MAPSAINSSSCGGMYSETAPRYSSVKDSNVLFQDLLSDASLKLPESLKSHAEDVIFTSPPWAELLFPCPFKQTEAVAILKGVESSIAAAIADVRYGAQRRKIAVSLDKCARYLMSAYICTLDGMGKLDPNVKPRLKNTDLNQAQSNIYRRFAANLYATKRPDEFFHLHGSLEASTALKMIGLPPFNPNLTEYKPVIEIIEQQMKTFTVEELEELNQANSQAGVKAYKREDILNTEFGKVFDEPLWQVDNIENETQPTKFTDDGSSKGPHRILAGIKVLEMCRVIAGPSITRTLAEYGADVLKITSPELSDVPWFQVELNMGKHATELNLKTTEGRTRFEELLVEADVVVDGYRHGALERLGLGIAKVQEVAKQRGKGIVYVSENCFGYGKWAERPGWQQIADCVSGVAWEQGRFMGLNEPIVPPFPMSDYGTGLMGAIAALIGLYHRATTGGSYHAKVALVKYDNLLFKMGLYPEQVQEELRNRFDGPYFELRHSDHTDVFSGACLKTMKKVVPQLFDNEAEFTETWWSDEYKGKIKVVKQVADIEGIWTGYQRPTRPNGSDRATWEGWEVSNPL